ncbi:MAG: hypothetical protein V1750_06080 [Acidobacteriota bacterium]
MEVYELSPGQPLLKPSASCYKGGAQPAIRIARLLESFPPARLQPKCNPATAWDADYSDYFGGLGPSRRAARW